MDQLDVVAVKRAFGDFLDQANSTRAQSYAHKGEWGTRDTRTGSFSHKNRGNPGGSLRISRAGAGI